MAAKLKCSVCEMVLKEVNDAGKTAQGEYRVYESVGFGESRGLKRAIECCSCGRIAPVEQWTEDELKELTKIP